MKFQFNYFVAAVATAFVFTSCSNDDAETISGKGAIALEFDNVFGSSKT